LPLLDTWTKSLFSTICSEPLCYKEVIWLRLLGLEQVAASIVEFMAPSVSASREEPACVQNLLVVFNASLRAFDVLEAGEF